MCDIKFKISGSDFILFYYLFGLSKIIILAKKN